MLGIQYFGARENGAKRKKKRYNPSPQDFNLVAPRMLEIP